MQFTTSKYEKMFLETGEFVIFFFDALLKVNFRTEQFHYRDLSRESNPGPILAAG
jgi:hypothetical protein